MKSIPAYSGITVMSIGLALMIFFQLNQTQASSLTQNQQIIVRFTERNNLEPKADHAAQIEARLARWRQKWGVQFSFVRYFGEYGWIVTIPERLDPGRMHDILTQLNHDPHIRYAEIDVTIKPTPRGGIEGGAGSRPQQKQAD